MKKLILSVCLLSSFAASAASPIFTLYYKTGFIAPEYATLKKCSVFDDHVEVYIENAQGTHTINRDNTPDAFWSDLITEAAQGNLVDDPYSSSFAVSEYLAYRNGKKIILKGFTEINESPAAADLIDVINSICK